MSSSQDDFSNTSDTELVKLAKAGNAHAFDLLFQRYKGRVRGYLTGLIGNSEEADDNTQQAFINAWNKLLTLHDESRFKPWIFRIARNLAYDYKRLQARSPSQSLENLKENLKERNDPVDGINLEDEILVNELVKLALAELPPKYRDCLLLLIKGGFSRSEIAELLNISKASVSTYICTSRRLFRKAYYRLKDEAGAIEKGD
jgi:RNA polymerase sigma-70 factor (ECF subfamily)